MEAVPIEYEIIRVWPLDWNDDAASTVSNESELESVNGKNVLEDPLDPPINLDLLLDNPPASEELQEKYGWNDEDKSANIYLKNQDPLTLHRNPVPRSTDGIRGKTGVTKGLHVWEIQWNIEDRGTHAAVGVATQEAPIHGIGYQTLVGNDDQSWGWNLIRNKVNHRGPNRRDEFAYPAWLEPDQHFLVPKTFLMVLDMDEGTLSFVVDGQYLGVAFRGLNGRKLFPMVSTVWGHSEITLKYIGGLDRKPYPLKNLCRRVIRQQIGSHCLEERIKSLELPNAMYAYLLFKDRI